MIREAMGVAVGKALGWLQDAPSSILCDAVVAVIDASIIYFWTVVEVSSTTGAS